MDEFERHCPREIWTESFTQFVQRKETLKYPERFRYFIDLIGNGATIEMARSILLARCRDQSARMDVVGLASRLKAGKYQDSRY